MHIRIRWTLDLVLFAMTCSAQTQGQGQCRDPKEFASKLAGEASQGIRSAELSFDNRYCAGTGLVLLAEDAFDGGRLADASRHIATAIRLFAEGESANHGIPLAALRLQGAIYVERGMLSEALAIIERLKALPVESPEQSATVRGLAGACYQAAGDQRAAEREYVQAIQGWDRIQKSGESVTERSNLGVLYLASRRFDEAVAVLERAYALAGSGKNAGYFRLVITNNLAVAYSERGDTALAVRHAREAVRLAEVTRTGRHELIASVYFNSAGVLRAAGHKKEANGLNEQASRAEALADAVVDFSDLGRGKRKRESGR